MNKETEENRQEQTIQISLPERHWVVLLAVLDETIRKTIVPEIEKLRQKGIKLDEVGATLDQIDDAHVTALAAPLLIRGVIVKELVARGIMAPDADARVGIDTLLKHAEDFKKRMAAGRSD